MFYINQNALFHVAHNNWTPPYNSWLPSALCHVYTRIFDDDDELAARPEYVNRDRQKSTKGRERFLETITLPGQHFPLQPIQPLGFCAVSGSGALVAGRPFVSRKPYAISNRILGGAAGQRDRCGRVA